jgi:hypothetical protein
MWGGKILAPIIEAVGKFWHKFPNGGTTTMEPSLARSCRLPWAVAHFIGNECKESQLPCKLILREHEAPCANTTPTKNPTRGNDYES